MPLVNILLVDDHAIVRAGFLRLLDTDFPGAAIVEAANGQEAMAHARARRWDIVILDISMPGRSGLEVLKEMHELHQDVPVLVMTMYSEEQYALRALRSGAAGYLTKGSAPAELIKAIRKVLEGGKYVSDSLAQRLASTLTQKDGSPLHDSLSDRELQVLRMLAGGKTVKEIGADLFLSDKTVSTYRARLLQKMDMRTTAELIRYAIRANLID
jgi:two-component system, NarL family, invasion response regulator UvrY